MPPMDEDVNVDVAGQAPAEGATPASGDGDESKFVAALKEAKLDKWADVANRWDKQRNEARSAVKAKDEELASLREQLEQVQAQAKGSSRKEELVARAIKQGFKRSNVNDFLDSNTLDDLEAELDKDAGKESGNRKRNSEVDELRKEVEALKSSLRTQNEDRTLSEQLMAALDEHAKDESDEFKGLVTSVIAQQIEIARARHQKLPNIDDAVSNAVRKFSSFASNVRESVKSELSKGLPRTGLAEKPNEAFQRQVASEEPDVQEALKLIQAAAGE